MTTQQITDQNDIRKYFGMIPHMADDDLSLHEYRLYGHYVRICGANGGTCAETERTTWKHCNMGKSKFLQARDGLVEKGYIQIIKEGVPNTKGQKGHPTMIALADIWAENVARYSITKGSSESPKESNQTPSARLKGSNQTPKGSNQTRKKNLRTIQEEDKRTIAPSIEVAGDNPSGQNALSEKTDDNDAPQKASKSVKENDKLKRIAKTNPPPDSAPPPSQSHDAGQGVDQPVAPQKKRKTKLTDHQHMTGVMAQIAFGIQDPTSLTRGTASSPAALSKVIRELFDNQFGAYDQAVGEYTVRKFKDWWDHAKKQKGTAQYHLNFPKFKGPFEPEFLAYLQTHDERIRTYLEKGLPDTAQAYLNGDSAPQSSYTPEEPQGELAKPQKPEKELTPEERENQIYTSYLDREPWWEDGKRVDHETRFARARTKMEADLKAGVIAI